MRTLRNAIVSGRIAHAYLFVGPRGTGKTTTARIFAKCLNATGGPNPDPDDSTPLAQAIMNGSSMDVIEIDGASNNSVDQVRQLREDCQYRPAEGTFKIYIIDEVHMLSTAAFNALLKTLEEPPPHVKFIFATTEADKVLPTITSRCQRFEFRPIADAVIVERLSLIADEEKIEVTPTALASIARMAQGGMRDAQSILDQLISFCGRRIDEPDVLEVYGLASVAQLERLGRGLAVGDPQDLLAVTDELGREGRDLVRVLNDLQVRVRDALLESVRAGGRTDRLGAPLATEQLMRLLEALGAGATGVQRGLSERVNFEVALLRAVDQSRSRSIDWLIKELNGVAADLPEDGPKKT